MAIINRLAAFWLVLFTVFALGAATPARADVISDYKAELDAMALEMRALAGEIERFKIQQRYCLPPYGPVKQPDTMLMQAYSARAEALNDKYNALKGSLQDFLKRNTWAHGRLQVAGKDPNDAGWWARWDNSRDKMIAERNAKRDALARAPERDCTPRAKPAIAVQPPPPLALPERPQIPPFNWPALPPHFCSELEKLNWRIANINPHWIREAEAAHAVAHYRSQIESLVNDLVQADKPIPPALAEARRQAIADVREMERVEKANAEFYRRFAAIPIIDCNPPPPKAEPPRAAVPAADPQPATPGEKFETGSKLDTIRNRAWAQLQAMDAAAKACDLAAFDAAFRELERLLEEAKAARFAATGASEFSNVTPKDAEGLVEALKDMVRQRRFQRDDIVRRCGQRPPATPSQTGFIPPSDPKMRTIFDAHNQLRAQYRAPGLSWDPALAAAAQDYAGTLARTGQLAHSPRAGRGISRENLSQGMLHWGPMQMIGNWLKERDKFRAGVYPNVSTTGRWEDVSHLTQMIWPDTKSIGCGVADGAESRWLVCRYSPGGNKDGKPVGQVFADGPKTTAPGDVAPTNSGMPINPSDLKLPKGGGMTQIDPPPGPPPPPPPPPTARDPAPEGDEARHPLRDYFMAANDQHRKAWLAGDLNGQADALAKMHYALQELLKRLRAARKAGPLSGVKPADVQKQIDELNQIYRTANEMSRLREPGEERG